MTGEGDSLCNEFQYKLWPYVPTEEEAVAEYGTPLGVIGWNTLYYVKQKMLADSFARRKGVDIQIAASRTDDGKDHKLMFGFRTARDRAIYLESQRLDVNHRVVSISDPKAPVP